MAPLPHHLAAPPSRVHNDVNATLDLHPDLAAEAMAIGLRQLGHIPADWTVETVKTPHSSNLRAEVRCKPVQVVDDDGN